MSNLTLEIKKKLKEQREKDITPERIQQNAERSKMSIKAYKKGFKSTPEDDNRVWE